MTGELSKLSNYDSGRIIIRDCEDETYPHVNNSMTFTWCRTNFHGIRNGLQLLLKHETVIIDRGGFWKVLPSENTDYGQDESKFHRINVKVIGHIAEENIVRVTLDGDEYYGDPQIIITAPIHGEPFAPFTFLRAVNDEVLDPVKRL